MAVIIGKNGSVKIGASTLIGEAKNWSLSHNRNILKITEFGNDYEIKTYGLGDWTCKMTANFDPGDTAGQAAIVNALKGATTVTIRLFTDASNQYNGTAYVKGVNTKADPGSLVEADFDLEGSGSLNTP